MNSSENAEKTESHTLANIPIRKMVAFPWLQGSKSNIAHACIEEMAG